MRAPALAAALAAAAALAVPSSPAHAASTTRVQVTGGALVWGLKASFRSYVRGPIAQGDYTTAGGATENPDGTLRFPATGGAYDTASGQTAVQLGGSVRFTGHAGALDMTFSALRVELDGAGGGTLYADAVSKPNTSGGAPTTYTGVAFARLDATGATAVRGDATVAWTGIGATLTDAGAPAFGGFYQPGQALDPADLAITTGGPVVDPPPPTTPDPGTPTTPTTPAAPPAPPVGGSGTQPTALRAPTVRAASGRIRLGRTRAATVATVRCLDGPCRVTAPTSVRVRTRDGRTLTFSVLRPTTLKSGATGTVRVRAAAAIAKRLKGRTATPAIRVVVTAGTRRTVLTVRPKLTA